jgi:uncharacterized metal-binding protein YceD (DUF177 family)
LRNIGPQHFILNSGFQIPLKIITFANLFKKGVKVDKNKAFDIEFMRLSDGLHEFSFDIDDSFFKLFQQDRILGGNLTCDVTLNKEETLLQLQFETQGSVNTTCDRCLNGLAYPVESFETLIVTLGSSYIEQDVDVIEIPSTEHKLNVAQYIYEYILTSIPMNVNCDGLENVICDEQTLKHIVPEVQGENKDIADPRWNALKNIDLNK